MIDKTKQVIMFAIGTILIVGFFLTMGFSLGKQSVTRANQVEISRQAEQLAKERHDKERASVLSQELVEEFLQFNDNTVERELFYQALNAALEVTLDDDLEMDDYEPNLRRMFGDERMEAVLGSIAGSVRFYGLTPTSMQLEGLDKHLRLLDSLKKLHAARARFAG